MEQGKHILSIEAGKHSMLWHIGTRYVDRHCSNGQLRKSAREKVSASMFMATVISTYNQTHFELSDCEYFYLPFVSALFMMVGQIAIQWSI